MTEQSNALALKLAAFWTMKNDQGQYLYSSLNFREETAEELRRLVAQRDALLEALKAVMALPDHLVDLRDEAKKARAAIRAVEE